MVGSGDERGLLSVAFYPDYATNGYFYENYTNNSGDTIIAHHSAVLNADAHLKVYEVKQGLTPELAAAIGASAGETFHFVLNNTVVKDNRIPPRGYTVADWDAPGLRPVGITFADGQFWDDTIYPLPADATRLTALLYYQTSSKKYIDFLRSRGGLDGMVLGELWDTSPSPPELMALTLVNGHNFYLPLIFK